jgi:hypothetical protein
MHGLVAEVGEQRVIEECGDIRAQDAANWNALRSSNVLATIFIPIGRPPAVGSRAVCA